MEVSGLKKLISSVKQSIENFWSKLNITSSDIIRYVSCFGIGFLVGLFLKRYVKYFVALVLFDILLLAILQYFNIVVINWEHIKAVCGFSETATFEAIMQKLLIDIRIHAISVGCAILGCLLGFKVG